MTLTVSGSAEFAFNLLRVFSVVIITFSLGGVDSGEDVLPGPPGGDRHTLVAASSLLILNTAGGRRGGGFHFTANIFSDSFPPLRSGGKRGASFRIVLPEERGGSVLVIKHD